MIYDIVLGSDRARPHITRFQVFCKMEEGRFRTKAGTNLWEPDGEAVRRVTKPQDPPPYMHGAVRTHDKAHTLYWIARPVVLRTGIEAPKNLPAFEISLLGPDRKVLAAQGGKWLIAGKLWAMQDQLSRTFYYGFIEAPEIGKLLLQVRPTIKSSASTKAQGETKSAFQA